MVLVKATKDSEAGIMPSTELFEAMGKFNEELINAGIMQAGEGLQPSAKGKRVAFDGPNRTVIDGPFSATRELVAGFWLWQVKDMAEAVEWVKRCPNPMPGPSEIEIRPLYEMADFGDAVTPEVAELHGRNREKLPRRGPDAGGLLLVGAQRPAQSSGNSLRLLARHERNPHVGFDQCLAATHDALLQDNRRATDLAGPRHDFDDFVDARGPQEIELHRAHDEMESRRFLRRLLE
jgi:hypothetical protein